MKKLFVAGLGVVVVLLACICVRASDINGGQTFTDGQKLTAAQLNALVGNATIQPSFFTGQVAAPSNLQSSDILLTVNGTGAFRKMAGSQIISAPAFFTNSAISTNFQPYSYLIYWNPSNSTVFQITGTAFGFMESSNLVPTNFPMATAGVNNLPAYTNTPSASNTTFQVLFPVYDTNGGILYSLGFTNLVAASATQLGTNNLVPYIWTNLFKSWTINATNPTSNAWLFFTNFPITNIVMANTNGTLITNFTIASTDTLAITSGPQFTNTTVTVGALQQFIQTNNPIINGSFTLTNIALPAGDGTVTNVSHGLGTTPRFVSVSLLCVTNDISYVVGDLVPMDLFISNAGNNVPAFTYGRNATNVFITQFISTGINIMVKGTGSYSANTITANRWRAVIYAVP